MAALDALAILLGVPLACAAFVGVGYGTDRLIAWVVKLVSRGAVSW